jgi:hypothetical protein
MVGFNATVSSILNDFLIREGLLDSVLCNLKIRISPNLYI